jgi:NAD(P)-dependent dehydrogenase (short-subunit alcohol dehydrogenase family)
MELREKVAVVTGGGSGIGRALCLALAAEGCAGVVVADLDEAAAEAVAAEVEAAGAAALAVACDVGDPAQVDGVRDLAVRRFGTVHLICNNAGILRSGAAWETTLSEWDATFSVNVWGVVNGIRTFVPHLIAQGEGHVVNTASLAGLTTNPGLAAYNASKHAVVAITETLHRDLALCGHEGVGVSVLCPGFVATAIADDPVTRTGSTEVGRLIGEVLATAVPVSMDPAEVAGAVVAAVREGRFYVLTHPDQTIPMVQARLGDIVEGRAPGQAVPSS